MSALKIAVTKLAATSAVTDITTAVGIYPITMPQAAVPPCLIVNVVSGQDEHMLTGAGKYYRHRVSVECLATTALGAEALGAAVMTALQDNANATIGSFTGVATQFADSDRTDFSDDRSVYRRTVDFFIRWRS